MINNPDGSPFKFSGSSSVYENKNKLLALFDKWDQEALIMGGSPIYYYEVLVPVDKIDQYLENRSKVWHVVPNKLWANYEPVGGQASQSQFGLDSYDEVMFELNANSTLQEIGHMPVVGSRIYTPHKGEHWEVVTRHLAEYKAWGATRLQLLCKRWQRDVKEPLPPPPPEQVIR